jgi:Protein of unknown function (DUF3602)
MSQTSPDEHSLPLDRLMLMQT